VVEPYYEKLADEQYERRQETNDENWKAVCDRLLRCVVCITNNQYPVGEHMNLKLRLEILNDDGSSIMYRDYAIYENEAPKLLTDEVQEMLDVIKDSNKWNTSPISSLT
jgi:hypothetical protein